MITVQKYSRKTHYDFLCQWWKGHKWNPAPAIFLPKLGVVAYHEGLPVAAGWCYCDNSTPLATLEWLVTNPNSHARLTLQALNLVIDFLSKQVKEFGYIAMLTNAHQPGLVRILEHRGFQQTDSGITHLVMLLDEKAKALQAVAQPQHDAVSTPTLLETGTDL